MSDFAFPDHPAAIFSLFSGYPAVISPKISARQPGPPPTLQSHFSRGTLQFSCLPKNLGFTPIKLGWVEKIDHPAIEWSVVIPVISDIFVDHPAAFFFGASDAPATTFSNGIALNRLRSPVLVVIIERGIY